MLTIKQLISRLDILLLETSTQSYQEYQDLMDELEALDYSAMTKLTDRHSRCHA